MKCGMMMIEEMVGGCEGGMVKCGESRKES